MGHLVPIFVPKHIFIMADLPASMTTLFDLKTKQSIANETIITHSTTVFARKLADYFKILYEDEAHIVGGFSKSQSLITIKITEGQGVKNVTMTLETPKDAFDNFNLRMEDCLEEVISEELKKEVPGCIKVNFLPAIKRCLKNPPYLRSADNRILEYKFDTVLFNKQSEFQQIQIVETQDFGRLLILNEYANLAENDRVEYTHTLMNLPHENYSGKEVLILGGGDGGLLKELIELPEGQAPSFVTMVDIDGMVMDACAEFMPNVCGKYLKRIHWDGDNYEVINGCAIQFMKDCLAKGKKFDFIMGDLTDTPISTKPRDEDLWNFLSTILDLAMKVLKPVTGKYLTHCNGVNVPESIKAYENVLSKICGGKCSFTKTKCYVKSFFETWVFYQITRSV